MYKEGDFSFEKEDHWKKALSVMYKVITDMNLWQLFDSDPPEDLGYIYWDNENVKKILDHPLVDECGHSGASFALCMRIMKRIRKYGWESYVNIVMQKNNQNIEMNPDSSTNGEKSTSYNEIISVNI